MIKITKGKISANNRRLITVKLIVNFNPESWARLFLKIRIQITAEIKGAKRDASNKKV